MRTLNVSEKLTLLVMAAILATWFVGSELLERGESVRAASGGTAESPEERDDGRSGGAASASDAAEPPAAVEDVSEPEATDEASAESEAAEGTAPPTPAAERRGPVRVRGRVVARGEGLPARLDWRPLDALGDEEARGHETDGAGAYAVTLTRGGLRLVRVLPTGFLDEVGTGGLELVVDVPHEAVARLELELPTGRLNGRLFDGAGAPVEDAFLELLPAGGEFGRLGGAPELRRTMSDQDGRFRFDFLAPGSYAVATTTDAAALEGASEGDPLHVTGDAIAVPADGDAALDLHLPASPAQTRVQVLADGEPVYGASVLLQRAGADELPPLVVGTTRRNGSLLLPGLDAELAYRVQARTAAAVSAVVPVEGEGTLALALLPARPLRVRCVDADDAPVPATVRVLAADAGAATWANAGPGPHAEDPARLLGPLLPGRYTLRAHDEGGRRGVATVSVEPGEGVVEALVRLERE